MTIESIAAAPSDAPQAIGPGTILGQRYVLGRLLGEGGMGRVFLAEDREEGGQVAIKVLTDDRPIPKAAQRFAREAESIAKIDHPNVVRVSHVGESPRGGLYYVMEYLEGEELTDTLDREGPMPWWRAQAIALQICGALQAAHESGVVHRDLKLENCFVVTNGQHPDFIKIVDFGVAKLLRPDDDGGRLTNTGATLGTPVYMAPELCRGKSVDHRVDVYALGVMLFELVTGELPFTGEGFLDVALLHMNEPPPPLANYLEPEQIPHGLEQVIGRALAKQREDRFPTMAAFGRALLEVGDEPAQSQPASPVDRERAVPRTNLGWTRPAMPAVDAPVTGPMQLVDERVMPTGDRPVARDRSVISGQTESVLDAIDDSPAAAPIQVWPWVLVAVVVLAGGIGGTLWWSASGPARTETASVAETSANIDPVAPEPEPAAPMVDVDAEAPAPESTPSPRTESAPAIMDDAATGAETQMAVAQDPPEPTKSPAPRSRKGWSTNPFDATVRRIRPRLAACAGVATGGKKGDKVRVKVQVDRGSGKVLDVTAKSVRGASGVEACVAQALRKANFPTAGSGRQTFSRTIKL